MLFEAYKATITDNQPRGIDLTLTRAGWRPKGPYSREYTEITQYHLPDIFALRRSLVLEKFHGDYCDSWRLATAGAGAIGLFEGIVSYDLENVIVGGTLLAGGYLLHRYAVANKRATDSKVDAFNRTFPDQKPVSYSLKDYLSTRIHNARDAISLFAINHHIG